LDLGQKARTGNPAYKPFGKSCIVFALKDRGSKIVSMYFRSTLQKKDVRHFYLRDRQGLFPGYPSESAKRLILTESIIDAASLLEQDGIKSKYEVLALFGTNGLTAEHQQAIKEMKQLEEIIFFLNGDEAGKSAVNKYAAMLKGEYEKVKISNVEVPENEDVNSLLQGHSGDVLVHLIESRKEYELLFSAEFSIEPVRPPGGKKGSETEVLEIKEVIEEVKEGKKVRKNSLDTNNPYNLKYEGNEAKYQIKGFKINQLDSLKITLQVASN
jgi:DNA primase (bacterial type)